MLPTLTSQENTVEAPNIFVHALHASGMVPLTCYENGTNEKSQGIQPILLGRTEMTQRIADEISNCTQPANSQEHNSLVNIRLESDSIEIPFHNRSASAATSF